MELHWAGPTVSYSLTAFTYNTVEIPDEGFDMADAYVWLGREPQAT